MIRFVGKNEDVRRIKHKEELIFEMISDNWEITAVEIPDYPSKDYIVVKISRKDKNRD